MESWDVIAEVERAQQGDQQSILNLIERFNPILRKYAHLLSYDDAYADLRCELILLIMKNLPPANDFVNDGAVTNYFEITIIHAYNRQVRKKTKGQAIVYFNELPDGDLNRIERQSATTDKYSEIYMDSLKQILTDAERRVLYRHYIQDFSIAEIACQDGIARQNVNKTKKRALDKLKKEYGDV